jgi:hypothetical protein
MSIRQFFPCQKRKPDTSVALKKMPTVIQLRKIAQRLKVPQYYRMTKAELIDVISSDAADIPGNKRLKTSRHRGVFWEKDNHRWVALIEKKERAAERSLKYYSTMEGYIRHKVYDCQASTKRRNARGRKLDFDIDAPFMIDLFAKQDVRCALSGIVMVHKPMSHWQASIDRIDTDLGYVRGNVRWVCLEFNGAAQWTPAKIKLARAAPLESTIDVDAVCKSMRQKPSWTVKNRRKRRSDSRQQCPATGATLHECRSCDQFLPVDAFYKQINKGCKQCQKQKERAWRQTPRGRIIAAFSHAESHSKERILKDTYRDDDSPCTLTFNDLVEIYAAQRGLCAYSGLPLRFDEGDWTISLERLDPRKNYSRTNCALVCHEFNPTDHSVRREGMESLGWSVEKMRVFRSLAQ